MCSFLFLMRLENIETYIRLNTFFSFAISMLKIPIIYQRQRNSKAFKLITSKIYLLLQEMNIIFQEINNLNIQQLLHRKINLMFLISIFR